MNMSGNTLTIWTVKEDLMKATARTDLIVVLVITLVLIYQKNAMELRIATMDLTSKTALWQLQGLFFPMCLKRLPIKACKLPFG